MTVKPFEESFLEKIVNVHWSGLYAIVYVWARFGPFLDATGAIEGTICLKATSGSILPGWPSTLPIINFTGGDASAVIGGSGQVSDDISTLLGKDGWISTTDVKAGGGGGDGGVGKVVDGYAVINLSRMKKKIPAPVQFELDISAIVTTGFINIDFDVVTVNHLRGIERNSATSGLIVSAGNGPAGATHGDVEGGGFDGSTQIIGAGKDIFYNQKAFDGEFTPGSGVPYPGFLGFEHVDNISHEIGSSAISGGDVWIAFYRPGHILLGTAIQGSESAAVLATGAVEQEIIGSDFPAGDPQPYNLVSAITLDLTNSKLPDANVAAVSGFN